MAATSAASKAPTRICQKLAKAAGATAKTWRAYLSTTGAKSVNARDRIGRGPWQNAKGEVVARTLDDLHSDKNNLNKQTALTETGEVVNGRGDKPNMHDILTGSSPEGRAVGGGDKDTTCNNWTSADAGSAIVGHHDRQGLDTSPPMLSWNSSHRRRAAASRRWSPPAATACSTASRRTDSVCRTSSRPSGSTPGGRCSCGYCAGAKALA